MRRRLACAAAASLFVAQAAQAQTLVKALCVDPTKSGPGDARALRSAALKGLTIDALDADADGAVSPDEIFAALTDPDFCTKGGRLKACSKEDNTTLAQAQGNLAGFWAEHPGVEVVALRSVTADELRARPGLGIEPWGPALDERGAFVRLRCVATETATAPPVPPNGPAPTEGTSSGALTPAARLRLGRFLLGKDVDSLTVQRGPATSKDALKKVAQAEIGLESNRDANTRTVSINGVAGIRLIDSKAVTLIPFVEYVRSEVRDRAAGTDKVTGKLGLGAVATAFFGSDQFDFAPRYAKDLKDRSELLSARLSWRPGFLYSLPSFRDATFFACSKRGALGGCAADDGGGLALWTDFQVIGSFGTVLRKGADPTLTDGREFLRVGPSGSMHIYGQSGLTRDISLDVSYKRLFRLAGDGSSIGSFKADVNYWIAGSQNVSLLYGYERSRDEETLKRTDLWKLGLGVRF